MKYAVMLPGKPLEMVFAAEVLPRIGEAVKLGDGDTLVYEVTDVLHRTQIDHRGKWISQVPTIMVKVAK